jgi:autotransporter-associated beta strand protein
MRLNVIRVIFQPAAVALVASLALASPTAAQTLAFPEAEGFGRFATGARASLASANIYHVTNLNDSGAGSLRDALSASNRFVVFDVGGIINLTSVVTVASNITIAGQTAPGGIQVWDNRVAFHGANNLVSRYWGVRLGRSQGRDADAASLVRGQNMMFDHMSITWGVDGTFDINPDSGQTIDNLTIQNSIIGQGLDTVGHSTGGLLTIGTGNRSSVIKSLFIDNATRNPKARGENEFINNVVYGWEQGGYLMGDTGAVSNANAEGNYFIYGVGNRIDHTGAAININPSAPFSSGSSSFSIYGNDNWVDGNRDGVLNGTPINSYPGSTVLASRHASFPTTTTMTAQDAVQFVRDNVGLSITRDAVDSRLVQEVASYGTLGSVILRETDVFPNYPNNASYLRPRARMVDSDNDGMPDNWETSRGLNPNNNSTSEWRAVTPSGYTRLEGYLNELGGYNVTRSATAGGAWTTAATWGGTLPDFATTAVATGGFTHASGNAFARQLSVSGSASTTGGTLDVFDTITIGQGAAGTLTIDNSVVSAGQVVVAPSGSSGALVLNGGTLQTGTIVTGGGTSSFQWNGGTIRATGVPKITLPIALGAAGGTIDTNGFDGEISGAIIGAGGITKNGAGKLKLSGANSFGSPVTINAGALVITNANSLGATPQVFLAAGTALDATAPGTVTALANQKLTGAGSVQGNLTAAAGSTVWPQGGTYVVQGQMIGVQAEAMTRGSDWALFNAATHGTGTGGSYGGAGLNGGGVVLVSGESLTTPSANGGLSTIVNIPAAGTWKLFVRICEPALSGVAGDPSTAAGGNNSFYASNNAALLGQTLSNPNDVQTLTSAANSATSHWSVVSATTALAGVVGSPPSTGIDYNLAAGPQTFTIYGREVGTILDGFVLSNINLTGAQLDSALAGVTSIGTAFSLGVTGNFTQQVNSTLRFDIGAGTFADTLQVGGAASLAGKLMVNLDPGLAPSPSDQFTILTASSVAGTFAGSPNGARVLTTEGGSFQVTYASNNVKLGNYLAPIASDFDRDGTVDAADLGVWNMAMAAGTIAGDANGDGQTDGSDFLLWQRQLGSSVLSVAAATAVPEPATLTLLLGTAIGLFAARRRARR